MAADDKGVHDRIRKQIGQVDKVLDELGLLGKKYRDEAEAQKKGKR